MAKVFIWLFTPAVALWVIALSIGVGVTMALAPTIRNVRLAHPFFTIATLWSLGCAFQWLANANDIYMKYLLAFALGGGIFAMALASYSWVEENHKEHLRPTQDSMPGPPTLRQDNPQPEAVPAPNLLVRYGPSTLPINIEPKETAFVLQLNPQISNWIWEIPNNKRKPVKWPNDIVAGKNRPVPDSIYICDITNPDATKTLLDVSITFETSFYKVEAVPSSYKSNKDGSSSISVTLPSTPLPPNSGRMTYARGGPGQAAEGFTEGALISSFKHSVNIPEIAPGKTVHVYLVNQSRFSAKFSFPTEATAVPTAGKRIGVVLVRPEVTILDVLPSFSLAPATYHWKGVPDAP